nr:RecName: Full=Oxidoreductase claN; AltName: Full=Cladofulvin biosynthesis cluster protein N [Fulvia fulva]
MSYTWLITRASSGRGAAIALAALEAGHKVIAGARNPAKASQVRPEIQNQGGTWLRLDDSTADVRHVIAKAAKEHGLNVLVNNAGGYALRGVLEDFSETELYQQMETNFFGPIRAIQGALPWSRAQKPGTIFNISSTSDITGFTGFSLYAASKAALEGASEALYGELALFGIRVLVVQPGASRTKFQSAGPRPAVSEACVGTTVDAILQRAVGMAAERR